MVPSETAVTVAEPNHNGFSHKPLNRLSPSKQNGDTAVRSVCIIDERHLQVNLLGSSAITEP